MLSKGTPLLRTRSGCDVASYGVGLALLVMSWEGFVIVCSQEVPRRLFTARRPNCNCVNLPPGAHEKVLVCEKGDAVGQGTTSRNSEVIHAGLYYEPGSLKARLCVQGRWAARGEVRRAYTPLLSATWCSSA